MKHYTTILIALVGLLAGLSVRSAELAVELTIPSVDIAEYHRPYVAVWVEDDRRKQVVQMALWLEKEKWHRDLRSWWRRGGSRILLPVDGVSGATRKPGQYRLSTSAELPPGSYTLNVEAVREVGGREHLRIPFEWNLQGRQLATSGRSELGDISLTITPENDQ